MACKRPASDASIAVAGEAAIAADGAGAGNCGADEAPSGGTAPATVAATRLIESDLLLAGRGGGVGNFGFAPVLPVADGDAGGIAASATVAERARAGKLGAVGGLGTFEGAGGGTVNVTFDAEAATVDAATVDAAAVAGIAAGGTAAAWVDAGGFDGAGVLKTTGPLGATGALGSAAAATGGAIFLAAVLFAARFVAAVPSGESPTAERAAGAGRFQPGGGTICTKLPHFGHSKI